MTRVVFATPNQGRHNQVRRLLPDIDVVFSRFGPVASEGTDIDSAARQRALRAFEALGERCMVENTCLQVEGEGAFRGSDWKALLASQGEGKLCAMFGGRAARTRVVVALAEGRETESVRLFEGSLEGRIAHVAHGDSAYGWDRLFIPEGFVRTLAELGESKYLLNMRHAPYLDLGDYLRKRSFGGAFEAHITVRAMTAESARFRACCDDLSVKCVLIELPAGEHIAQPMTASIHRGTLREVQDEVHELARALVSHGFEVVRTKIEALPKNADIPETDADAARTPMNYFEYHVKLALPEGTDLSPIQALCEQYQARLSRNANTRREDGSEERFVTLRAFRLGRSSADARFAELEASLAALGLKLRGRIREYTVYDSNLAHDRGWI